MTRKKKTIALLAFTALNIAAIATLAMSQSGPRPGGDNDYGNTVPQSVDRHILEIVAQNGITPLPHAPPPNYTPLDWFYLVGVDDQSAFVQIIIAFDPGLGEVYGYTIRRGRGYPATIWTHPDTRNFGVMDAWETGPGDANFDGIVDDADVMLVLKNMDAIYRGIRH